MFRAGVDLIQLDVTVLDRDGRPVHGLTKDDFTLIDRGVTRPIATFADLANDRPPSPLLPANLPLDVANNQTAASDRLVVIVLDDFVSARGPEAKALVYQVVEGIGAGATLCLVTTSRELDVKLTEDRSRILLADGSFRLIDSIQGAPAPPTAASPDMARRISRRPSARLTTYRFVGNVAKMIGADDGRRKAFVWISAGVPGAGLQHHFVQKVPSGMRDPCDGGAESAWTCTEIAGMLEKLHRSTTSRSTA